MARNKQEPKKSQKGQDVPELTEDQAREHLEKLRWPSGLVCIECASDQVYRLGGQSTRDGLIKCRSCKAQFSVTVGTIMEDSHLPLAKWVKAFHFMVSSKKGISALQLQRNLGLGSYKTAWHLAHRIRYAMSDPNHPALKGDVQIDETYVGGKPRRGDGKVHFPGRGTSKTPVVALVETNGNVHSAPMEHVTATNLKAAMEQVVHPSARIVTDEFSAYTKPARGFSGGHSTVNHSAGQYVNEDGFHTNTVESYFALLKRGIHGAFHHVSKTHLHRYCDEFSFRWNGRKINDAERRTLALQQIEGKRLMYRQPAGLA